jgi:two-component system cell cycle response regulator DivK
MSGDEPEQSAARRILIVEDNALNLKLLADLLDYKGYSIAVTGLGESAIDIACQQLPDLILLDIQLPDISGTEVALRLKADPRTRAIPIIAVTAFAMSGERANILASGCDDYVAKPIRLLEFLELVARYASRPRERPSGIADLRSGRKRRQRSSDRSLGERRVRKTPWTGFERRSGRDRRLNEGREAGGERRSGA